MDVSGAAFFYFPNTNPRIHTQAPTTKQDATKAEELAEEAMASVSSNAARSPEWRLAASSLILVPDRFEHLRVMSTRRSILAWKQQLVPAVMVLLDALVLLLMWKVGSIIQGIWGHGTLSEQTVFAMVAVTTTWVCLRAVLGLYPGYGLDAAEQWRRHFYATVGTLAIVAIFALSFQVGDLLSRLLLAVVFLSLFVLTPLAQHLARWVMRRAGLWGKPVVVLSYKDAGTNVVDVLKERWELGYDPVAVFEYRLDAVVRSPEDKNGQRAIGEVVQLSREYDVDTAIFAMPNTRREQLVELVSLASRSFPQVLIVPNLGGLTNAAVVARDLGGTFAVEIKYNLLDVWALRTKRVVDLLVTVAGSIVILPVLLGIALLILLESGRPIFYRDWRMGKDGAHFSCMKFRTMEANAELLLQRMLEEDESCREEYSKYHKLRNDPRVTRVGRILRRTSLDELPQLWNVLLGEMSLVGPRPYLPRESQEIGLVQREILRVPPGITGPWQVAGRNSLFFEERVQMDVGYIRDWSIWLDIAILARTSKALFIDRSTY